MKTSEFKDWTAADFIGLALVLAALLGLKYLVISDRHERKLEHQRAGWRVERINDVSGPWKIERIEDAPRDTTAQAMTIWGK